MPGACRNHHGISDSHRPLFLLVEDESALALFDPEALVDVLMHFIADLFPRSQAHHHELDMLSSE
jgi:hypothetical protein